jgi:hypothetical protein
VFFSVTLHSGFLSQKALLLTGFSGSGKSNITLILALLGFARGDAVVYLPSCDVWKSLGDKENRAKHWLASARVSLSKHFEQPAKSMPAYTWGELLFLPDAVKAYQAIMHELHLYEGDTFAVLMFFDEQSKVADVESVILHEAATFKVFFLFFFGVCRQLIVGAVSLRPPVKPSHGCVRTESCNIMG